MSQQARSSASINGKPLKPRCIASGAGVMSRAPWDMTAQVRALSTGLVTPARSLDHNRVTALGPQPSHDAGKELDRHRLRIRDSHQDRRGFLSRSLRMIDVGNKLNAVGSGHANAPLYANGELCR